MSENRILKVGIIGAIITALCCFTPILPIVLGAVGLSSLIGFLYNDFVLFPILLGFLALSVYAMWKARVADRN